jgi:large subunit ribosomal protein L40
LSDEEIESRALLNKEWTKYKRQEHLKDIQAIDSIFYSQQKALDELKAESKELYQEAIQVINYLI